MWGLRANTVFAALKEKLFGIRSGSRSLARSRLHFVLVQDRTGLSNEEMSLFKEEMVRVIEKYFVIDKEGFDITYRRDQELTTLQIHSPIVFRREKERDNNNSKIKELTVKKRETKLPQEEPSKPLTNIGETVPIDTNNLPVKSPEESSPSDIKESVKLDNASTNNLQESPVKQAVNSSIEHDPPH